MRKRAARPWASPIESAIIRPRHKFGIDGRLLVCPVIFPCAFAIVFAHGWWQAGMAVVTFACWTAAKVLWEFDPWFIDDFQVELASPRSFTDVRHAKDM